MSMRKTLHSGGLLLLSLLVARSWGRHEADYYYVDCDGLYAQYYPEICADHSVDAISDQQCVFEITLPNTTEVEVTQMALCHVHCIDEYYSGSNFNLELLPGFPNWDIIPRDLLHINLRGTDCLSFLNLMDCRRGCMIQSRSSSSDCARTCAVDECRSALATLVPPCGRRCSQGECMTGCGTVFDTVMNSVNIPEAFHAPINPVAPPNLTQLLDEDMQPTARYRVDISGAVSRDESAQFIRGGFSTLIFQVQNTSSGEFYYYWVEEDELNLEAFNHEEVNVTFAVATVAFGTSSYSPAVTLEVEAIEPVVDFPEQLTLDNISFSFTRDNRTDFAGQFLLNISWEKPEGFERATGYTVSLSALGAGCGVFIPATTYELEPTQIGLDLESSSSHRFRTDCFFTVTVQVNPLCPSDTVATDPAVVVPQFDDLVRDELDQGAIISCPAVFNDSFIRYDVTLAWTLEITPLVLGLISRFIIRTFRVRASNPENVIGFVDDTVEITHEDKSQMNYTLPVSYAPIVAPNTAYTIRIFISWDTARSASNLPLYSLPCHVGTLPPEPPGVVTGFTITETTIVDSFLDGRRMVDVTVNYTWLNLVSLDDSEDTIVDYDVWFANAPLAASAEPPGPVDSYPESATRGISVERFTSSLPVFTAYLQIRARATYGRDSTSTGRVIPGDWSVPLEVVIAPPLVPLALRFIGDTPRVVGNTVNWQFTLNRPARSVTCQVSRNDKRDCSSGNVTFSGLEPRRYLLRVAATNSREDRVVVRRRFEISTDSSFCTVHLINDGVTVEENRTTVEFTGSGIAESFLCQLDQEDGFLCTSPVELRVTEAGEHRLRISPQGCGRNRRNQVIVFNKED